MADDLGAASYAAMRDSIINNLQGDTVIPIDFSPKEDQSDELYLKAINLGLLTPDPSRAVDSPVYKPYAHVRVLPIDLRFRLNTIADKLVAASGDKKTVSFTLNDDSTAIDWILSNCIVCPEGKAIFRPGDVSKINHTYLPVVCFMCWEALDKNGLVPKGEHQNVGN